MDQEIKAFGGVLYSEEQIARRVAELGDVISRDYAGKELMLVAVLKGSVVFLADLMRSIKIPCGIGFIGTSSYSGISTTKSVTITIPLTQSVKGKNVIIVEDILDTGYTLQTLKAYMLEDQGAKDVRICTMLDKPGRREVPEIKADYYGFAIPNEFVIGYGLDYNEMYRNLPFIGTLDESKL
ncbi:MAG: hypoxanthine phosphoribosyltransferase [Clostridia bacterium]|nr:hypoxanthine phosphoribosyltransferase [Clostridia bacterium]